jgi:Zn-dependent M28 family amino/carboxypeptidase
MNGADDNASGCAAVMEIAEALSDSRPRRSVLFVLLSAEEVGLLGSRHCAANLPVPAEKAKLYINVDMIGHTVEELREQRGIYISGSGLSSGILLNLLDDANNPDFGVGLTQGKDDETFKRTDQFFFYERGIQTIGFEAGYHEHYHRPTDDPEMLDYDKTRDVARLILSFVSKLGNVSGPICEAESADMNP